MVPSIGQFARRRLAVAVLFFIRATGTHPFIDLGELKFPQLADPVPPVRIGRNAATLV